MKECTKCRIVKPLVNYHNSKKTADGKKHYCKSCSSVESKAWRDANPERFKANRKRWKKENPEKVRAYARLAHLANLENKEECENV